MEQWKNVVGYEGSYLISSLGRVFSISSNKVLKTYINKLGYERIEFNVGGTNRKYFVHRLVAEAFVPNPSNLPIVNHRDENPSNNKADNLEWCTHKYNLNYGTCIQRRVAHTAYKHGADHAQSKKVYQFDLKGNFIKEYGSAGEAANETGLERKSICKCGTGHLKTYGGYVWKYTNKFELEPKKCTPRKGAVLMFDMNHNLLKRYDFAKQVIEDGFKYSSVCRCCRGERNHYANHIWEYAK